MSRSLGDGYAHSLGCSCEPEIIHYVLKPEDKIIILGSDGIFEHLSNTQVANIVYPFYIKDKSKDVEGAAKALV